MCAFPVPIELIIVLGGTLASKYLYLQRDYSVKILGNIPTGFPGKLTFITYILYGNIFMGCLESRHFYNHGPKS